MQENLEIHRHQLLTALAQSAESLRNAAAMVDSFANLVQLTPQVGVPVSSMNPMAMYQMFANLQQQAGAVGAPFGAGVPVNTNGVVPGMSGGDMKVEEGGKRKRRRGEKKEKKPRDPNRPKRPPSAYLLFQNEVRKEMQERFPSMPYHELLSKISERWSHMSDTEKKIYNDQTAVSKVKFQEDKAVYDAQIAVGTGNGFIAPAKPDVQVVAPAQQASEEDEDLSEVSSLKEKVDEASSEAGSDSGSNNESDGSEDEDPKSKKKKGQAPPSKTAVTPAALAANDKRKKRKEKKASKD